MANFVKLTTNENLEYWINLDCVENLSRSKNGTCLSFANSQGEYWMAVKETPEEILDKVKPKFDPENLKKMMDQRREERAKQVLEKSKG